MNKQWTCAAACGLGVLLAGSLWMQAENPPAAKDPKSSPGAAANRPSPKPLSGNVERGLAWLAKNQLDNGAWAQGEESSHMGSSLSGIKDTPNVADTCMVVMALFRSGNTPRAGEYCGQVLKGVKFICAQVEESDSTSLSITSLKGTRTQMKLGTYIDTFMAAQVLAEMKDQMGDEATAKRVEAALAKVVKKIEANQRQDGRWANEGWAPTLAQAQASKALNIAAQKGMKVDEKVRERAESSARAEFQGKAVRGVAAKSGGDAGVGLYSAGAQIAAMQGSENTNATEREQLRKIIASPSSQPAQVAMAKEKLDRYDANASDLRAAQSGVIAKMDDKQFMAGFGSNGGEEFLSYLNIGESLFLKGGPDWEKWDKSITGNLTRIQNQDGSWTGHHCITGRTFCTAAAVMVLTIDRSPAPAAGKIQEAKNK